VLDSQSLIPKQVRGVSRIDSFDLASPGGFDLSDGSSRLA